MFAKLTLSLYSLLLKLYPPGFRLMFADEMEEVFSEAMLEARRRGIFSYVATLVGELCTLPSSALRQRLIDGNRDEDLSARSQADRQPSKNELFLAMAAFFLPLMLTLPHLESGGLVLTPLLLFALFLVGVVLLLGMIWGLPRWALPYLGLATSAFSFFYVYDWIIDLVSVPILDKLGLGPWDNGMRLVIQGLWAGLMWLELFIVTAVVITVLALLKRFHKFYEEIRRDWTRVSLILYSGTVIALLLLFDRYRYREPFMIASLFCLASGVWLYLRSQIAWQRALALVSGVTVAMAAAALGKWLILPQQDWPIWFYWHSPNGERWLEVGVVLLEWIWIVGMLLLPAGIKSWLARGGRVNPS